MLIKRYLNKIICDDVLRALKKFPDASVDCVIFSPPYWQLRDYGWKGQWGLERTYGEYLDNLWTLMNELRRVIKEYGTVWVNLGDNYGTQSGTSKGFKFKSASTGNYVGNGSVLLKGKVPHKSLILLPHRFAIGCMERGWLVRNDIVWAKPNGIPESIKDRFSKKHEYIFLFAKRKKYYFDLDSVREQHQEGSIARTKRAWNGHREKGSAYENINPKIMCHPLGRNPGDVTDFWKIPTRSGHDKHYAKYNSELITKPIMAGCPRNGIVLDPFCGTGTTGITAIELGRKFIGIEGKKAYCAIAQRNIRDALKRKLSANKHEIHASQKLNTGFK